MWPHLKGPRDAGSLLSWVEDTRGLSVTPEESRASVEKVGGRGGLGFEGLESKASRRQSLGPLEPGPPCLRRAHLNIRRNGPGAMLSAAWDPLSQHPPAQNTGDPGCQGRGSQTPQGPASGGITEGF